MKLPIASSVACAALALLAYSGVTQSAHGAGIHKCANRGSVAYQTDPCGEGQTELAVLSTPARPSRSDSPAGARLDSAGANVDGAVSQGTGLSQQTVRASAQWLPFRRRTIAAGMTDDEVLNTTDGGVPTRISRSRQGRSWHETWIYESRDGTVRELEFLNGRLTSITRDRDASASLKLASAIE